MAGDILPFAFLDRYADFIDYVADHFESVYWVPGNHEYYGYDIGNKSSPLKETIRSNVFLVNNIHVPYDHIDLYFSTLWSHISPANEWEIGRCLRDFDLIHINQQKFTPRHFSSLHQESRSFLEANLPTVEGRQSMIISHHVPTLMHYPKKYRNSPLNEGFAVELYDLIEGSGADYWLYGHHHFNVPTFKIGSTDMITNQLGYVEHGENSGFTVNALVQMGL